MRTTFLLLGVTACAATGTRQAMVPGAAPPAALLEEGESAQLMEQLEAANSTVAAAIGELVQTLQGHLAQQFSTLSTDASNSHAAFQTCGNAMRACHLSIKNTQAAATAATAAALVTAQGNLTAASTGTIEVPYDWVQQPDKSLVEKDAENKILTAWGNYQTWVGYVAAAQSAATAAEQGETLAYVNCGSTFETCLCSATSNYEAKKTELLGIQTLMENDYRTFATLACLADAIVSDDAAAREACKNQTGLDVSSVQFNFPTAPKTDSLDCTKNPAELEAKVTCDGSEGSRAYFQSCTNMYCWVSGMVGSGRPNLQYTGNHFVTDYDVTTSSYDECNTCLDEWCASSSSSVWCPNHESKIRDTCQPLA